jgi:hypothetical protein
MPAFRDRVGMRLVVLLSLGLTSAACGATGAGEPTAERAAAIVAGEPSPSPADDAVVLLRNLTVAGGAICTATMVAPNLVATARHCVAYASEGSFLCSPRGEPIALSDGGGLLGADVPADTIEIYAGEVTGSTLVAKGQEIVSTLSLTTCINDLAFVVLDRPLALPLVSLRLGTKTAAGEPITVIGYGIQQLGPLELDWPERPRKKAHQTIEEVGPDDSAQVTMVIPRTIVTSPGPAGCRGDSGAPALSEKTGALVGVYTNRVGSDDCASPSTVHHYTNLPPFQKLALDAFARAHAEPMLERRTPMGGPCSENFDCDDATCAAGDDGVKRCTRTCGPAAPCPDGYECRTPPKLDGPNVCAKPAAPDSGACPACDAGPPPPPPAPGDDGGCAMARARRDRPLPMVAAVALGAWITRRRTSRPRRSRGNSPPSRTRTS